MSCEHAPRRVGRSAVVAGVRRPDARLLRIRAGEVAAACLMLLRQACGRPGCVAPEVAHVH